MTTGGDVYGVDFPPSQFDQDWSSIFNISTTTFIAGDVEVAVSATAPTSGRLFVAVGAGLRNNAATSEQVAFTFQVFEDTPDGALFLAADETRGVKSIGISSSQEFQYHGNADIVEGLSPGRSYYFQTVYRSVNGASTADITSRNILVVPVP